MAAADRPLCEPLHSKSAEAARPSCSGGEAIFRILRSTMTTKTADQIRFILLLTTMISVSALMGILPTLWRAF